MMPEQDDPSPEEYFPAIESFPDFAGKQREFVIELHTQPRGYFLRAHEKRRSGGEQGYTFAAYSPSDPFYALGVLRGKIRKGLATRYLSFEHGMRLPSHDILKGNIGFGGVVIDGEFVLFEELCSMMQTYEGFQFSLAITDPYDEV